MILEKVFIGPRNKTWKLSNRRTQTSHSSGKSSSWDKLLPIRPWSTCTSAPLRSIQSAATTPRSLRAPWQTSRRRSLFTNKSKMAHWWTQVKFKKWTKMRKTAREDLKVRTKSTWGIGRSSSTMRASRSRHLSPRLRRRTPLISPKCTFISGILRLRTRVGMQKTMFNPLESSARTRKCERSTSRPCSKNARWQQAPTIWKNLRNTTKTELSASYVWISRNYKKIRNTWMHKISMIRRRVICVSDRVNTSTTKPACSTGWSSIWTSWSAPTAAAKCTVSPSQVWSDPNKFNNVFKFI